MKGLRKFQKESMFAREQMMLELYFPQPDIYKKCSKNGGWRPVDGLTGTASTDLAV
jgi:hypothetical protein